MTNIKYKAFETNDYVFIKRPLQAFRNLLVVRGFPICILLECKTPHITLQKTPFRNVNGHLLRFIRSSVG